MQAIILAAGMGRRLKEYTSDNTKCMVEVCGETLIERALRQLDTKHLTRIVIVTGYKGDKLRAFAETRYMTGPTISILCLWQKKCYVRTIPSSLNQT